MRTLLKQTVFFFFFSFFMWQQPLIAKAYVPKIYDCFMFLNEFEVLELRLEELYPYVDKFVIVEACETHRTAKPKPFYFELNKERYAKYADKIIHIKLTEHIEGQDGWVRENWQRNQIMRGLTQCHPEDLILISDCDEFIPGKILPQVYKHVSHYGVFGFWQKLYAWYLNRETGQLWSGTGAIKYKDLVLMSPQELRVKVRCEPNLPRWHIGWHFTWMGGYESVKEKCFDIVEGHDNFPDYDTWRKHVIAHKPVPIDSTYPQYVQDHIEELIKKNLIDPDPIYVP